MFKAHYYKSDGKKGQARKLPDVLFDGVVNEGVLHQVVKAYLANQRQGTGSAKNRSAVRGGSRKPWRQKGTGRARQGTIRAAQWAGGGRAFPPIPHSWRQRVPRKVKALARRSAFNFRAAEDRVVLVEGFDFEVPKTREIREYLKALDLDGAKVLILTAGLKEAVYLSCRNLRNVRVLPFGEESPYDILHADIVVIEHAAVDDLGPASEDEVPADEKPAAKKKAPAKKKPAEKKADKKPAAKKKADEKPAAKKKAPAKKKPAAKKKADEKPAAKKKAPAKKKPAAKKADKKPAAKKKAPAKKKADAKKVEDKEGESDV